MLLHLSSRTLRNLAISLFFLCVALGAALGATWFYILRERYQRDEPPPPPPILVQPVPVSPLLLEYKLDLPGRGEIFPALAGTSAAEYWPVAILSITNRSDTPSIHTVTAEVPGWTRSSVQTLIVGPRETRQIRLNPPLLPRAYDSHEVRRAELDVRVNSPNGDTLFSEKKPVLLHSGAELYWGKRFANAQLVARWVTPHDPAVLKLVSEARRYAPRGRLGGYNISRSASKTVLQTQVRSQAEAIFRALQKSGISYVSSIFVYGEFINQAQRIRLPRETLELNNANCMDVSVLFASAMENLGLQPVVVIVPGHAFAGVRLGPQSQEILYLDLTVLPKGSFKQAESRALGWLKKTGTEQQLTVDIAATRALGIYPLSLEQVPPTTASLAVEDARNKAAGQNRNESGTLVP
ncbi:MAG TPA: hypothetical protein VN577_02045 [Terriglobales bacterium]|nr:hypothetical protein [Terriglobales bacterium]